MGNRQVHHVARVGNVRETHFGVVIDDPYRWMEDVGSGELQDWLTSQATHAREVLNALPDRAALAARIAELEVAAPELSQLRMAGSRCFYLRRLPGAQLPDLVVRNSVVGIERVLAGSLAIDGFSRTAIDWYVPSPDGRRVAYGWSEGGSENSTMAFVDVDTGEHLDGGMSGVVFPFVSWLDGNQSVVYHRYREPPPGTPPAERRLDSRTYLHRLGDDPERDRPIFGRDLNDRVTMRDVDRPFVLVPVDSSWTVGIVSHSALGDDEWTDCTFYVAPRASLEDPTTCPWLRVATVDDAIRNFAIDGDTLYLVSARRAPRYEVLAVQLPDVDLANARVVVPESERVIDDVALAGDVLLVRERDAGIARLRRVPLTGGDPYDVALPVDGTILDFAAEPGNDDVLVSMTSWTVAPRVYRIDIATGAATDLGWVAPSAIDFGDIVSLEVSVAARDGTLVPLSIVHHRDVPRDGNRPTLITAYGSYGFPYPAYFRPEMLAWYERGGVWAIAHVRGGGEHGRDWHEAGRMLNKENTITDLIACAEHLVAHEYTCSARLACEGQSAGGIPVGGAMVRRPDLWAVVLMRVALTNALRFERGENGPINIPEFGSVTTEDGFHSLAIIDSYARVEDGVHYPAVLLTTGLNDARMDVWQATKMAARLQAATGSAMPVLLRVDEHGGHGGSATKRQLDEELADLLAFTLDQFDR
jgi:prolyl oligopeptidase